MNIPFLIRWSSASCNVVAALLTKLINPKLKLQHVHAPLPPPFLPPAPRSSPPLLLPPPLSEF